MAVLVTVLVIVVVGATVFGCHTVGLGVVL